MKGTNLLIQALPRILEQVPNSKLLILNCVENNKARSNLVELAKKLGVDSNVEFLPFIDDGDLPYYYSMAEVLVQPSIHESFLLPVHEANACETPVVCFSGGSVEEEVIHGETGFIAPLYDIDELARLTIEILMRPELGQRMGKAGRERQRQMFTWDIHADALWKAIEEVAARGVSR